MITRITESNTLIKIFHVIVNVNLMVVNTLQIKSGINISVNVSAKIQ